LTQPATGQAFDLRNGRPWPDVGPGHCAALFVVAGVELLGLGVLGQLNHNSA
jgi:hypothetical protein